jgi:hypothetical protein
VYFVVSLLTCSLFCGFSFFFRGFLHVCGAFRRSVAFFKMEKANIEIES